MKEYKKINELLDFVLTECGDMEYGTYDWYLSDFSNDDVIALEIGSDDAEILTKSFSMQHILYASNLAKEQFDKIIALLDITCATRDLNLHKSDLSELKDMEGLELVHFGRINDIPELPKSVYKFSSDYEIDYPGFYLKEKFNEFFLYERLTNKINWEGSKI